MEKIANQNQNSELINIVKKICDRLRSSMEVNEYRDYILGFLFYKYLSEKIESNLNFLLEKEKINYKNFNSSHTRYDDFKNYIIDNQGFFIDYDYSFQNALEQINEGKKIIKLIDQGFGQIEKLSNGLIFDRLFQKIELNDLKLGKFLDEREFIVQFIVKELSKIKLSFHENSDDILGTTYEYLLSEFASDGGKKAGEFYTPSSVAELIVKIAGYNLGEETIEAYDPTCGSGSLLLKLFYKTNKIKKIYGQEKQPATYNLAKINFVLRGMNYSKFDIKEGCTLTNPGHDQKFDCIVANPPFSAKWSPDLVQKNIRYSDWGILAPKSKADFAFLQHMLYHIKPGSGIIVSVFSLGILQRDGAEKKIREYIIKKNWIDTIIMLPSNLFFNTSIASCILVARKNKKNNTNIFFIDATNEFEENKKQNIFSSKNINKIFKTWVNKKDIKHFSKMVTLEEIEKNNYSLSVSKYVEPAEFETEIIDIDQVNMELANIDKEIHELNELFEKNLKTFEKTNNFKLEKESSN